MDISGTNSHTESSEDVFEAVEIMFNPLNEYEQICDTFSCSYSSFLEELHGGNIYLCDLHSSIGLHLRFPNHVMSVWKCGKGKDLFRPFFHISILGEIDWWSGI